ncbi:hypothetical protein [Nostoc sp. UHCC 0870]
MTGDRGQVTGDRGQVTGDRGQEEVLSIPPVPSTQYPIPSTQ